MTEDRLREMAAKIAAVAIQGKDSSTVYFRDTDGKLHLSVIGDGRNGGRVSWWSLGAVSIARARQHAYEILAVCDAVEREVKGDAA